MQREFGIPDDSDDGRMLGLIAQSLDFITCLRIGDALPPEVLSGQASWEPDALHLQIANARLQWQLVAWLNSGTGGDTPNLDADALLQVADDPARRQQVQEAFTKAAEALGLPSREAVIAAGRGVGAGAGLYRGAARPAAAPRDGDGGEAEPHGAELSRRCLASRDADPGAAPDPCGVEADRPPRFEELDAQTGEVMAALRNADSQRTFIRSNRDWLYRTQRAWQSLLAEWDVAGIGFDEGILLLLNRSYQFLAPRYMPVTEWASQSRPAKRKQDTERRMVW